MFLRVNCLLGYKTDVKKDSCLAVCLYACIYVCMYVYVCVCVCVSGSSLFVWLCFLCYLLRFAERTGNIHNTHRSSGIIVLLLFSQMSDYLFFLIPYPCLSVAGCRVTVEEGR